MTNSHTINDTSTAAKPQEKQEEDRKPVILHYVPKTAARKHKRSIALCGQDMDSAGVTFVRKARKTG